MAETYLITAKTVEEAVSVAKREYEDSRHEVSYEIVEMPKKGFLGLGAKPAKIKVTVSKVMTVQSELGSLVADIKSLKNLTDREGRDGHEAKKPQTPAQAPAEAEGQKKPQNQTQKQQNQNQKGQNQNGRQSRKQNQSGAQQQNAAQDVGQQNGSQQSGSQNGGQQKQGQQPQKQQNGQQSQKQNRNQNQQNQNGQKQSQPVKEQQKKQAEAAPEKKPAPAQEKPVQEKPVQEKTPAAEAAAAEAPVAEAEKTPAFGESTGYRSALGNQAKPQRRNRQRKSAKSAEEAAVESTGVTVSAPVGLTDFVSEPAENGFGVVSQDTPAGSGRMNNDVRRKNRQQKDAPKPAVPTVAAPTVIATAAEAAESAPSESGPSRNRRGRRPSNIQKAVNEDMASKYDIAETDEDYEKLDRLTAEADVIEMGSGRAARDYSGDESAEPTAQTPPPAEDRKREAITREEMDYALEFANTLLRNMQLDARAVAAECPEGEEFVVTETADVYPKIDIIGSETGILIGHHGETLDSIQYLVNLSALRKTKSRDGDYVKIVVDIENYREKREETLRSLARRMAARAVRYKRNVFLEPMNAYERRIIHSELQSFENVSTHSVGADRDRKIIITYEGPGRMPDKDADAAAQTQSRRKRRGEDAAEKPAQERSEGRRKQRAAEEDAAEKPAQRDRRPKKPAKMPIEQLTDWLPDAGTAETEETSGDEDVLHVMSGLRETFREAVEEIDEVMDELAEQEEAVSDAAEEVEETVSDAAEEIEEAVSEEPSSEELPAEEPVEEPFEEPSAEPAIAEEPAEEPVEEPVEEPSEEPVEEAVAEVEAVAETVEEAVTEAAETAGESFEEKAQALTDVIESIGDPSPEDPSPADPDNTEAE